MLRRSGFKPRKPKHEPSAAEREPRPMAKLERSVSYAGTTGPAVPKVLTYRDPVLLEMQHGRPCKLLAVENCELGRGDTTVAAHENQGKGMGIKASDARSVGACYQCHTWYDQSDSPRAEKRRAFMAAHLRQVLEWRRIVGDRTEPERYRKAARRALDALNATEVGDMA